MTIAFIQLPILRKTGHNNINVMQNFSLCMKPKYIIHIEAL